MDFSELYNYINAINSTKNEEIIISGWRIINFLNILIGGKFKDLNDYLPKKRGKVVKTVKDGLLNKAINKAKQLGHMI